MALQRCFNQQIGKLILNRRNSQFLNHQLINQLNYANLNFRFHSNSNLNQFKRSLSNSTNYKQIKKTMSSTESDNQVLTNEQFDQQFNNKPAHLLIRKYDEQNEIFLRLQFKYKLINKDKHQIKEKMFSFKRKTDEPIRAVIDRMKLNVAQFVMACKMKNKKRSNNSIDAGKIDNQNLLNIELFHKGNDLIQQNIQLGELFNYSDKEEFKLIINDSEYKLYFNPQFISSCKLPKIVMNNFEVFPSVQIDFRNDLEPLYGWFKKIDKKHPNYEQLKIEKKLLDFNMIKLSDQLTYVPTLDDVGSELIFRVTSRLNEKQNLETYEVTSRKVLKSPNYFPFEKRHELTKNKTADDEIRIVSYNILADMYSDSKTAREELFKHCPAQFLTMDYRKHLLFKELLGYNADLICLQEVDFNVFDKHLEPAFKLKTNLVGLISLKNKMQEGCAIFYNQEKFKLIDKVDLIISDLIKKDCFKELDEQIKQNFQLNSRFSVRPNILQMVVLECLTDQNQIILVFNTHFYFHPDSDHIRLLQSCLIMKEIEDMVDKFKKLNLNKSVRPILAGDFNSCPEFGVYKLFTEGKIDQNLEDWRSCKLLFLSLNIIIDLLTKLILFFL